MKKKTFFLLAIGIIIFYLVSVFLILGVENRYSVKLDSGTQAQPNAFDLITKEEKEAVDQSYYVQLFSENLPHQGEYVKVEYNFDSDTITVRIPEEARVEGNEELDRLLAKNSIDNRGWLKNLNIIYE